jgi:hypothetical protein
MYPLLSCNSPSRLKIPEPLPDLVAQVCSLMNLGGLTEQEAPANQPRDFSGGESSRWLL